ncbi:zinc finger protein 260-like [Chironomus tepperi]|uniref:zinc finger protein 260-like n=1 Tax=Chironomus tepperi TaxID=113505 RepID=UPI00391EEAAA
MSFSCENLCRSCMEVTQSGSVLLFNKKKKKKTQICLNYEEICNLKVKEEDQLPQQLCMSCVSELNKSFAFRERCIRTYKTLCAYLDLSEDEEEPETIILEQSSKELPKIDETYEEIEVTDALLDAAKVKASETSDEVMLEMDEIQTILNSSNRSRNDAKNESEADDGLVFIIQNVTDQEPTIESKSPKVSSYKCGLCELTFVRKKNFDNHVRKYHEDGDIDEAPPDKRIRLKLAKDDKEDSQALWEKLQQNPDAKSCKMCGALYVNEKSLKLHERRNACQQKSYQCSQCPKVFTDQQLFREHTETHPQDSNQPPEEVTSPKVDADPAKKFQCDYENCGKSFKMLSTLKDHLRTHSNEKPFICNICGRGFSQNTNLKQHLRRHTQIKPFKCNFEGCGSAFVSKGELDSHSRKHSGEHPFKCDMCDAKFTTSSSLTKHKRIHSGEKPYACEFCPMRFTALGTLKNHTKTHTGEKPHKCKFCKRAFTQKSDLTAHERTHTGTRPFTCNICNSSFHQSGTLKSHMKIHGNVDNEDHENEEQKSSTEKEKS